MSWAQVAKELRLTGKLLRRGSKNCEPARRCRRRDRQPKGLLRICLLRRLSLLFPKLRLSVPTNSFSRTSPSIGKHADRRAFCFCGGNSSPGSAQRVAADCYSSSPTNLKKIRRG